MFHTAKGASIVFESPNIRPSRYVTLGGTLDLYLQPRGVLM
jgi:hypothetical protein